MSFYTGKNGSKVQAHITKGSHDITQMRGGPFKDTVFHSDIDYITFTKYPVTSTEFTKLYTSGQYNEPPWSQLVWDDAKSAYLHSFSWECTNKIIEQNYAYIVVLKDGEILMPSSQMSCVECVANDFYLECYDADGNPYDDVWEKEAWEQDGYVGRIWANNIRSSTYGPWMPHSDLWSNPGYEFTDCNIKGYKKKIITTSSAKVDYIIVFNFKYDGTFDKYPNIRANGEIRINKSTFNVGGKDIAKLKYWTVGQINTIDPTISSPGTGNNNAFQAINQIHPVGNSISFSSKPGLSELKIDGKTIINSNINVPAVSGAITYNYGTIQESSFRGKALTILTMDYKIHKNGDLICGFINNKGKGYQTDCGKIVTHSFKFPFFGVYEEGKGIAVQIVFYTSGDTWSRHYDTNNRIYCSGGKLLLQVVYNNGVHHTVESPYTYGGQVQLIKFY